MINKFFFIIKRIVVSALMLYSFNVIVSSLEFSIPINFINVILISVFDVFAMLCLIVFSFTF